MAVFSITAATADVRDTPDATALRGKKETQLVFGETFAVESEENDGWCFGHSTHDDYKGYIQKEYLGPTETATHIVSSARSHLYTAPDIKSPRLDTFSLGSRVVITKTEGKFSQLSTAAWIYTDHLSPIAETHEDYIATARQFIETPYVWGGRSGFGIDCSGLVQVALARAGISVPRDTEQQIFAIGSKVESPRTGDIVFFKGHVGIMVDADSLLHANAHHMKTVVEPLWTVEQRSGSITAIKRI